MAAKYQTKGKCQKYFLKNMVKKEWNKEEGLVQRLKTHNLRRFLMIGIFPSISHSLAVRHHQSFFVSSSFCVATFVAILLDFIKSEVRF